MMYIGIVISFFLPVIIFKIGYAMKPKAIPFAMLNDNGMIISIRKAGRASVRSSKGISLRD